MTNVPFSIGIDAGFSSVKIVVLSQKKEIIWKRYSLHKSSLKQVLLELVNEIPEDIKSNIKYGAFSGLLSRTICTKAENSSQALIEGVKAAFPQTESIVEIGGQTAQFITGIKDGNIRFSSNNNCAAGTGSFFEDQMQRLGTDIESYSDFIKNATSVPRIAGRCTVFAKSDIIHLQQEGEKTENILNGLCYALVKNFKGTIIRTADYKKPVFFAGGTVKNSGVIQSFKEVLKLSDSELIVSELNPVIQAFGTALLALQKQSTIDFNFFEKSLLLQNNNTDKNNEQNKSLKPLTDEYPSEDLHKITPLKEGENVYLGIDVGSTSTNFVLINEQNEIVDLQYFKTLGNSLQAVQKGFDNLKNKYADKLNIVYSGITGSGRILIAEKLGIPVVKDEITAQATGTIFLKPDTDTIFEIGGQDSKYISIKNGVTKDFQMNKVCSAGTGSFVEDQAERLGITAAELGKRALKAQNPCDIGERCTVFMKTNIENCLSQKNTIEDISAGLCYSIVKNYLHKVVANKFVGNHICFQGGLAFNHGIVAAFKQFYGNRLSVIPYFSVTGALGMALMAKESYAKSLKEDIKKTEQVLEQIEKTKELNKFIFDNLKNSTFGKYEELIDKEEKKEPKSRKYLNKKVVGIPRALMIYKLFPFAYTFFTELGYRVCISEWTNEQTVLKSQALVKEETCFPVKLLHAHMQYLIQKNVDYIFLPSVYTMRHKHSSLEHNYGCVYMQTAAKFVAQGLGIKQKGIKLLNPVLQMDMGAPSIVKEMITMGIKLGHNPVKCQKALIKAAIALKKAQNDDEETGRKILQNACPEEKILVLITRNYGVNDPVLNMGIPEILRDKGYKLITLANLEGHSVCTKDEFPNVYWPFGQHILGGAKIIKNNPNLYAIYLTNHGCGPDTMLNHLFAEVMGNKPYLNIEVDEHFSKTGLITRIEAFLSNLEKNKNKDYIENTFACGCGEHADCSKNINYLLNNNLLHINKSLPLYIPDIPELSEIIKDKLTKEQYNVKLLKQTTPQSLNLGRANTVSKEYVTFAGITGDILTFAQNNPKSQEKKQILIFQTEGSEAEGVYARVIRSKLNELNRDDIILFAPVLENLIQLLNKDNTDFFNILWSSFLEYDINKNKEPLNPELPSVFVTGDPLIIMNKSLNAGFIDWVKTNKANVVTQSLSEYMLFLWSDKIKNAKKINRIALKRFKECKKQIKELKVSLDFETLIKKADSKFKLLSGANARYRFARKAITPLVNNTKIEYELIVSSLYENATTILKMAEDENTDLPYMYIQFDGNKITEDYEKFETFLLFKR